MVGVREVAELRWVREHPGRPGCIPAGRPRGAKRDGVKFEEALEGFLPKGTRRGVWLEFSDTGGHGFAQVDFLIPAGGDAVVVGEAKLTWRLEAYVQLRKLYLPLLRELYGPRLLGAVVLCRNLTWETPRVQVADGLGEALRRIRLMRSIIPVVHYVPATMVRPSAKATKGGYGAVA